MREDGNLFACFCFLAAANLILDANALHREADRWDRAGYRDVARIRRRMADRVMAQARRLVGDRGLPWGET